MLLIFCVISSHSKEQTPYIVGTGQQRLIIDTAQGYRAWADLIKVTLEEQTIALSQVFSTHWHGDHPGGVADLIQMYPNLADVIYKNSPEQGQRQIDDGQLFCVEDATIGAIHSPGHTHDHMCFILEEENPMSTGNNVLGHGATIVEQLGLYMEPLGKLQMHRCGVGYLAHGAGISDPLSKIALELAHKTRREKQCLAALDKICSIEQSEERFNSVTVSELIEVIHGEHLDEQMRRLALEPSMDEILRKLAEDGKLAFHVWKGVKRWFALSTE